jgi:RNA polymerase sigma factor (TIGR02999 family)
MGKTESLYRLTDNDGEPFHSPLHTGTADLRLGFSFLAMASMSEVTYILSAIEQGDPHAAEQLLPLVYDELRRLAAQHLAQEKPGQTLEATALVHEAYLRLVAGERRDCSPPWQNRRHFYAAAAEAMRRILVENARRKYSVRHGGGRERVDLDEAMSLPEPRPDLLALDEALARLAEKQPLKAELVKLRFFAGLTMPEAAQALGVSLATAERYWTFARCWLYAELADPDHNPHS